ncbi:MAG: hypothetical protein WDM88_08745 [Galbitalea sp.]
MKLSGRLGAIALLVAVGALIVGPAAPALATDSTTTTFAASGTQTVAFGTNWLVPITVAGSNQYDTVDAASGTVNILVKGIAGVYATGLPLTAGGQAFFSPPSSQPPLGAGSYEITAVYVPAAGSGLAGSQSASPAVLTITPIKLSTSFVVQKTTVDNKPGAEVVATVQPPSSSESIPAGSWKIAATDSTGKVAFEKQVPLAKNPADPVAVTLTQHVKPGHDYSITAEFSPNSTVAGGYQVTNGPSQTITVEAESFGEVLSAPIDVPPWALGLIGLGLALLIAAGIVLFVQRPRKPTNDAVASGGTGDETTRSEAISPAVPVAPEE